MADLSLPTRTLLSLVLALLLASFPTQAEAVGAADGSSLPSLEAFIGAVGNGETDALRGIYVPEVLASWIVPQPEGERAFISSDENTLTQFGLAALFGSTGLLAHNTLAGRDFSTVEVGQVFYLVYGDGRTDSFRVSQIRRFWALDPQDSLSMFFDLKKPRLLTAAQLFLEVYDQPGNVILQTCIDANEEPSWGRLFVIAEPYTLLPKRRNAR